MALLRTSTVVLGLTSNSCHGLGLAGRFAVGLYVDLFAAASITCSHFNHTRLFYPHPRILVALRLSSFLPLQDCLSKISLFQDVCTRRGILPAVDDETEEHTPVVVRNDPQPTPQHHAKQSPSQVSLSCATDIFSNPSAPPKSLAV